MAGRECQATVESIFRRRDAQVAKIELAKALDCADFPNFPAYGRLGEAFTAPRELLER